MRSNGRRDDRYGRSSLKNLLLIGCGKMGSALLKGWIINPDYKIAVIDPMPRPDDIKKSSGFFWHKSVDEISPAFKPDAIIIAIKPQLMATTLPVYAQYKNCVFLSIAAGQSIKHLSNLLGESSIPIVRAMPNLPASIGMGISVAVANPQVSSDQRTLCNELLKAAGDVEWITDESLIDAVTALSGSGPAYLFAMLEAMATAGEKLGLPPDLSMRLARQTVVGSGALLDQSSESATELRQAVTSPAGTTAAALECLMAEGGLTELILATMRAAAKRAGELAV